MSDPDVTRGTFLGDRPLAAVLAHATARKATGALHLDHRERSARIYLQAGLVVDVVVSPPIAYLGGVLYEMGVIDAHTLDVTLLEVARSGRLHGEILVERGAVTPAQLQEGLIEQTCRKISFLHSLPEDTVVTFENGPHVLERLRSIGRPHIEPWAAVWRSLREQAPAEHVRLQLDRLDGPLTVHDLTHTDGFGLAPEERALVVRLSERPATVAEFVKSSGLKPSHAERLLYFLALARCLVRAEAERSELQRHTIVERAATIGREDAWTVLGLARGAPVEAVRAAYLRLVAVWQPERLPPVLDDVRAECEHVRACLTDAYHILLDDYAPAPTPEPARAGEEEEAPPTTRPTLRDIDAALAHSDFARAEALARTVASAGTDDGPAARAVSAWCESGAGRGKTEVLTLALTALDRIVTGDPECARAFYYRGQIQKTLGRADAAQRDFRRAAKLDPAHIDAQRELRIHAMRTRKGSGQVRIDDGGPPTARGSGLRQLLARVASMT